jgi:hypothetical protein
MEFLTYWHRLVLVLVGYLWLVIRAMNIMEDEPGCKETTSEQKNEISTADEDRNVSFRDLVSNTHTYIYMYIYNCFVLSIRLSYCENAV